MKDLLSKVWKLVNPGLAFLLFTGLVIFLIKIIGYPRILGSVFMLLKEALVSFNFSVIILLPVMLIIAVSVIVNRKPLQIVISILLNLALFGSIWYLVNRVIFKELYHTKTLVGGKPVRLIFVTPVTIILNVLIIAGFIAAIILLYKVMIKVSNKLFDKDFLLFPEKLSKTISRVAILFVILFVSLNLIYLMLSGLILPSSVDNHTKSKNKVYHIGIDGADWNILEPLMKQGKLPVLKNLIDNGARANLLAPPNYIISGPSWTSIATGMTVSKHKVISNFARVKKPRIWNILNRHGYSNIVLNWICSPDAEKLKGFFITGPYDQPKSYPVNLINRVNRKFGIYHPDVDSREISEAFVQSCYDVTKQRADVTEFLLSKKSPDFMSVVFTSSDRLMHFLWQYYQPEKFDFKISPSELTKYSGAIEDYFINLDPLLAKLIKTADKQNTTFIIVSDHGFEAIPRVKVSTNDLELNYFLSKVGLFRLDRNLQLDITGNYAREETPAGNINRVLFVSDLDDIESMVEMLNSVRLKGTNENLFFNIREKNGKIRLSIETTLLPVYSERVIFTYKGKDYEYPLEEFIYRNKLRTGDHRRAGIIIFSGNGIRKGVSLPDLKSYDILPTILAIYGLPQSLEMDGIPAYDAFTDEIRANMKSGYISSYKYVKKKLLRSESTNKEAAEKLKSLGYLN